MRVLHYGEAKNIDVDFIYKNRQVIIIASMEEIKFYNKIAKELDVL